MIKPSSKKRLLGAHVSTLGGLVKGVERGGELGCNVIQLFTKNNNQWLAPPLIKDEIDAFQQALEVNGIRVVIAHAGYLINLATTNPSIHEQSLKSMRLELERAESLEIPFLIAHPGSHKDEGEIVGIMQVVENMRILLEETEGFRVRLLFETTAGQGTSLGWTFEQLAEILERLDFNPRLGICLDTAHIFQAGYDIRKKGLYEGVLKEFDEVIGLKYLKVVHLNDSIKGLGTRVDRHEHIGKGEIGIEPFKWFLNDRRLREIPMLIETPKETGLEEDKKNLKILRSLIA